MYTQVENPKENTASANRRKSSAVANSVTQKKTIGAQRFEFVDNRAEAVFQRQLQENLNEAIQLYPKKKEDSDEYYDPDYPLLTLIKLKNYGEYQIKGTDKILYYENGEGYYNDKLLTSKADMSEYIGEKRPGIANCGGKTYDFYEAKVTEGYMLMAAALEMLERFGKAKESNRDIDTTKVANITKEFKERRPVHPIEVRRGKDGYDLVQGRHRIFAAWKYGFECIPFNVI